MEQIESYNYKDVVMTPYLTPTFHYLNPSFIGNIYIDKFYTDHYSHRAVTSRRCAYIKPTAFFNDQCIYGGFLFSHFGHFLIESLANLYFIKKLKKDFPIIYSFGHHDKLLRYQKELFELLGLKNEVVVINEVTQFNNIYIPLPGSCLGSYILKEQLAALGVKSDNHINGKRLYISRKFFTGRTAVNEEALEQILKDRGWEICYPERMSIVDQLGLYSSSETIFTITGSALHSLLLLNNPRQRFIVMPRTHHQTYNMIADAKSNNYYLLNIERKILHGDNITRQSFELNIEQIANILDYTNNFKNIDNNRIFTQPQKIDYDYTVLPEFFKEKPEIKPLLQDSLFYRILFFNNKNKDIEKAKKSFRMLIKNNLLSPYMIAACEEFVNTNYAQMKDIFYNYLRRINLVKNKIVLKYNYQIDKNNYNKNNKLSYETHISNRGWLGASPWGWINGDPENVEKIEAIRIFGSDVDIFYAVYTREDGWIKAKNGEIAGTIGKSRPIKGILVFVNPVFNILFEYRVYLKDKGWTAWHENGETINFSESVACALQIRNKYLRQLQAAVINQNNNFFASCINGVQECCHGNCE